MTKIAVKGGFEGITGGFAVQTSFPVGLNPCQSNIDKIKLKKKIIYVEHHGEVEGRVSSSITSLDLEKATMKKLGMKKSKRKKLE